MKKLMLLTAVVFISYSIFAQSYPHLTTKEAYFYERRANHKGQPDASDAEDFMKCFYPYKYKLAKDDEFARNKMLSDGKNEITEGMNKVDLSKTFSAEYENTLDEYQFELGWFPFDGPLFDSRYLRLSIDSTQKGHSYYRWEDAHELTVSKIENSEAFDFVVKMNEQQAADFVSRRKNFKTGKVDRSVNLEFIYQLTNNAFDTKEGAVISLKKIIVWENRGKTRKLGEIEPVMNGERKLVYWEPTYRTFNYKKYAPKYIEVFTLQNGIITSPSKRYYVTSNQLAQEGSYSSYMPLQKTGEWKSYFENGKLESIYNYDKYGRFDGRWVLLKKGLSSPSGYSECTIRYYMHGQEKCMLYYTYNSHGDNKWGQRAQHAWMCGRPGSDCQVCDLNLADCFTQDLAFYGEVVYEDENYSYTNAYHDTCSGKSGAPKSPYNQNSGNALGNFSRNELLSGTWNINISGVNYFAGWKWHGNIEYRDTENGTLTTTLDYVTSTASKNVQKHLGESEINPCKVTITGIPGKEVITIEEQSNDAARIILYNGVNQLSGTISSKSNGTLMGNVIATRPK